MSGKCYFWTVYVSMKRLVLAALIIFGVGMMIPSEACAHMPMKELKRNKKLYNEVKDCYNWLVKKGYSREAAAGILGNANVESDYNAGIYGRSYYGAWQMSYGQYSRYVSFAEKRGLKTHSLKSQFTFIESGLENDFKTFVSGLSFKKYKKTNSIDVGTEGFCIAYERCTGGSDIYTSVIPKLNYGCRYQALNLRKQMAREIYKEFAKKKKS